jgi:hypothetical protein
MVEFALHTLGWKAFQDLSATILREVLGQTLQIFNPGKDGGRDAAFVGNWTAQRGESFLPHLASKGARNRLQVAV